MFGWGKKRGDRAAAPSASVERSAGEPIIAALLLDSDVYPLSGLQKALDRGQIVGERPINLDISDAGLTGNIADEMIAVSPMPAPYPWSDLEGPCQTSWMWPPGTNASSLKSHLTHVLVVLIGGKSSPVVRRLMLMQLTAMAAKQPGVVGVYWPDATLVHHPQIFAEMSAITKSVEAPPLYVLVDFRVFRNRDGTSGLFTTGMSALGRMDFEIPSLRMPPGELREWAVNIAFYILENAGKIKDGDTMGATEDQQIQIRFMPSLYGKSEQVMRFIA